MTSPAPFQGFMVGDQICDQSCDLQGEGGRTAPVSDPVFDDLRIRNLARAVVDGGLGARVELGIAIGLALVGGKR